MALEIIVTNAGRAAIVNAQNTGTDPVTITQIGLSQTAVTPAASATALPGEFKRISGVGGAVVAADTIHVVAIDESADTYSLRSFALYLADGTLFAVYGQASAIAEKSASSMTALSIDVVFADIDAASLTFGDTDFMLPTANTDRQGIVELATVAEAQAGIDALRALTPAAAKAAVLGWLLTQDGSGSGLDADLLDGQDGGYYSNIVARLGYTPLNVALYTAADVLAKLLTVDGPGSGLDADLLDGQDGGYYSNIVARLGYSPLNAVLYTAADVLAKLLTVDGSGSGLDADLLDGQHGAYYSNIPARLGYTPLNASSYTAADVLAKLLTVDGSGSGLDADLLDGKHASAFAELAGAAFSGPVSVNANISLVGGTPFIFLGTANIGVGSPGRLSLYNDMTGNERLAINAAGNVIVGGTRTVPAQYPDYPGSGNFRVSAGSPGGFSISTYDTQNYTALQIVRDNDGSSIQTGSITCSETSVSFNQTSDYRLKENPEPIVGALARMRLATAIRFNFKGHTRRVDGFMAHDVAPAVPEAVHGEKDAIEVIGTARSQRRDENGVILIGQYDEVTHIPEAHAPQGWTWVATGVRDVPQQLDQSKLSPLIWAGVLEAEDLIVALEQRVAALEA